MTNKQALTLAQDHVRNGLGWTDAEAVDLIPDPQVPDTFVVLVRSDRMKRENGQAELTLLIESGEVVADAIPAEDFYRIQANQ